MNQPLLDTALALHAAGCSVIPVRTDGTKTPAVTWKAYQQQPPAEDQLLTWFRHPSAYEGLGVITGAVSGGLEMLEVEGRALQLVNDLATLFHDNGYTELWQRLGLGYMERSPSGGIHWLYRVTDAPARGNTKLARKPGPVDERTGKPTVEVLVETRGEGGYVVVAPSGGRTHSSGNGWSMIAGGPQSIPTVTAEERDFIYAAASLLDQMPPAEDPSPRPTTNSTDTPAGGRPGDDYNTRATWDDILTPHGWTRTKTFGNRGYGWTRPGKNARDGISATTGTSGDGADRLYVFSSSTEFDTERPYSKFAAYALLEHAGDHSAAAAALRKAGYGAPLEQPRPTQHQATGGIPIADGNTAPAPAPAPQPAREPAVQVLTEPTTYTLTDDGNALRLVDTHAGLIRYIPQRGAWLTWNGHKWIWDEAEHVHELARAIARDLPADDKTTAKHRSYSLSARGVQAMVRLARSDRRTVAHIDQLDNQPYELNTPHGVVDLRTGQLHDPNPLQLHTRSTNLAPATGPAPRWEGFLAETFAGDPELTTYVQRILGQAIIGAVLEQMLPFAFGAGANGKTTLLGVIQRLVGIGDQGYSISSPAELLLATHQQGHPTEIARLAGARLVVTSELEDGQRFAEAKVKMLTGRDTISGRFMRQDWFSFTPTHTLFLLANHKPEVRAGGTAFWRRLALLPFIHTVPPERRNPHLEDELVEHEGPQILAWLIAGAVDYLRDGITAPASVTTATEQYAEDQDTVARFVNDCCDLAPAGTQTYTAASSQIRTAYEKWCTQEGETPVPAKTLTLSLTSRFGIISKRTSSARMLDGIRLKPEDDASPQNPDAASQEWWQR